MKLQEIANDQLYKELELLEPEYYSARYGTPEQTTEYYHDLFRRINLVIAKYGIVFIAEMYHKSRSKDKIELWRTNWKRGPRNTKIKSGDWITITKGLESAGKSKQLDETFRNNNNKEDGNPWEDV